MRKAWIVVIAISALLGGVEVWAELSAKQLHEICSKAEADSKEASALLATVCAAYVGGINDGMQLAFGWAKVDAPYCLPADGITNELLSAIYIKFYLKHRQEVSDTTARVATLLALVEEYPCPKGGP